MADPRTEEQRLKDVAERLGGGADYDLLREQGFAREGDLGRLIESGSVNQLETGRCELTDKGHRRVYPLRRTSEGESLPEYDGDL